MAMDLLLMKAYQRISPAILLVQRKGFTSEPTYYVWKNKCAGMEVSQLRQLKDVEGELARLKRMYADLALEHHALKDVLSRKG
jgi:putative transposase